MNYSIMGFEDEFKSDKAEKFWKNVEEFDGFYLRKPNIKYQLYKFCSTNKINGENFENYL